MLLLLSNLLSPYAAEAGADNEEDSSAGKTEAESDGMKLKMIWVVTLSISTHYLLQFFLNNYHPFNATPGVGTIIQ